MMNIDEDGEFAFLAALAIGAAIGAGSYTASIAFSDGGFNNWSWGGFAQSAGIGAVSGVLTAGIGSVFGGVEGAASNSFGAQALNEAGRAAAHGLAQGGLSELQGGSFKNGFASGAIGSLGGSVFQATAGAKFANSIGGTVGFSALSGGVGAELSGGNFWRGAGTGATIGLLNHYAHKIENDINEKKLSNKAKILAKKLNLSETEIKELLSKPMLDPYTKKLLDMSNEELIQEYKNKLNEREIIFNKIRENNKNLLGEYKRIRYNQIITLSRIGMRTAFFPFSVAIPDELIDALIPPLD